MSNIAMMVSLLLICPRKITICLYKKIDATYPVQADIAVPGDGSDCVLPGVLA